MFKKIVILTFIFGATSVAWLFLGGSLSARTNGQSRLLRNSVGQLWGNSQTQLSPTVSYKKNHENVEFKEINGKIEKKVVKTTEKIPVNLFSSEIKTKIKLKHRKKGLLWYATYKNDFVGKFKVVNNTNSKYNFEMLYSFPTTKAVFDGFSVSVDGKELENISPKNGCLKIPFDLESLMGKTIEISYKTQGLDDWWYKLGNSVSRIRNFSMEIITDFDDIDFPDNSMSPTFKEKIDGGWKLNWNFENLISDVRIGLKMPEKLNPGPFVSNVTFFAPVSLFLFFFLLFIITSIKKIKIHPMNYFFIAASFFSFHLLLSYLVDHINIHLAFIICSVVSVFLVISYMRLVVGLKFALLEVGISQIVFLVLFSYSFFFDGFTGLTITIACIITLFIIMQLTGRTNWSEISKEM